MCRHKERESICRDAEMAIYAIMLGQCTRDLRAELEAHDSFADVNANSNLMGLATLIRATAFTGGQNGDYLFNARQAERAFLECKQNGKTSHINSLPDQIPRNFHH